MAANHDQDSESLHAVYAELAKDAHTIAADLNASVSAYYLLGFYLLAFSFGVDLYVVMTNSLALFDPVATVFWVVFANSVPIVSGIFLLHRYHKLNTKYRTLFCLDKKLCVKEFQAKESANGT